jgi:hypothetical protein
MAIMSKNRGKSKNVLFNANKHVSHCEKTLGTFFYGQPSYFNVSSTHVCCRLSNPQDLAQLEGLGKFKNSPHHLTYIE